jgi:hypothetical protein
MEHNGGVTTKTLTKVGLARERVNDNGDPATGVSQSLDRRLRFRVCRERSLALEVLGRDVVEELAELLDLVLLLLGNG